MIVNINKLPIEILKMIIDNTSLKIKDLMEFKGTCKKISFLISEYINVHIHKTICEKNIYNKIVLFINIKENNMFKIIKGVIYNRFNNDNYVVYIKNFCDIYKIFQINMFKKENLKNIEFILTNENNIKIQTSSIFFRLYEYKINYKHIIFDFISITKCMDSYPGIIDDFLNLIEKINDIEILECNDYNENEIMQIMKYIKDNNINIRKLKWNNSNVNFNNLKKLCLNENINEILIKNNIKNRKYKNKIDTKIKLNNEKNKLKKVEIHLYY